MAEDNTSQLSVNVTQTQDIELPVQGMGHAEEASVMLEGILNVPFEPVAHEEDKEEADVEAEAEREEDGGFLDEEAESLEEKGGDEDVDMELDNDDNVEGEEKGDMGMTEDERKIYVAIKEYLEPMSIETIGTTKRSDVKKHIKSKFSKAIVKQHKEFINEKTEEIVNFLQEAADAYEEADAAPADENEIEGAEYENEEASYEEAANEDEYESNPEADEEYVERKTTRKRKNRSVESGTKASKKPKKSKKPKLRDEDDDDEEGEGLGNRGPRTSGKGTKQKEKQQEDDRNLLLEKAQFFLEKMKEAHKQDKKKIMPWVE